MGVEFKQFVHENGLKVIFFAPSCSCIELFVIVGHMLFEFRIEILLVETEISKFIVGHINSLSVKLSKEVIYVAALNAAVVTEVVDIHFLVIVVTELVDNSTLFCIAVHSDIGVIVVPVVA